MRRIKYLDKKHSSYAQDEIFYTKILHGKWKKDYSTTFTGVPTSVQL